MKVLHVFDHSLPIYDGYSFRSKAILLAQRQHGVTTLQLTTPRQNASLLDSEAVGEGLEFFRSPAATGPLSRMPIASYFAEMAQTRVRLKQIIQQHSPDLIHAHSPILNARPAVQAAREAGLPLVYEIRAFWEDAAVDQNTTSEGSLRYRLTRALETKLCGQANHVVTICEGLRNDLLGRGLSSEKVSVVPNAIDPSGFTPDATPVSNLFDQHKLSKGSVLGFFGSFYGYEGIDLLIRAMPLIHAQRPEVKLLLGGSGEQDANLRALTQELKLQDHVIFLGRIPASEMSKHYRSIDLLVLPRHSLRLTELVTPLKPLEAMLHRIPVVASDVGGHREMIADQETGRLFTSGNLPSLSATVLEALANKDETDRQIEQAYQFVLKERNWGSVSRRYLDIYQRLRRR